MSKQSLILLYGGRSAEREVSVLSAESVMFAVNYDKFVVKTFFITQTGDFVKTQVFTEMPAQGTKLMTNATIVAADIVSPASIYEERLSFLSSTVLWEKMDQSKGFLRCSKCLMWGRTSLQRV